MRELGRLATALIREPQSPFLSGRGAYACGLTHQAGFHPLVKDGYKQAQP